MNEYGWNAIQRNKISGPASLLVRFSGWEGRGTLWSAHSEDPRTFRSLEELISEMEADMDASGCPALSEPTIRIERQKRIAPDWKRQGNADRIPCGCLCAVTIQVRFRQQNDMQGEVQICGTGKSACFRSVLELLALLRSALEETGGLRNTGKGRAFSSGT